MKKSIGSALVSASALGVAAYVAMVLADNPDWMQDTTLAFTVVFLLSGLYVQGGQGSGQTDAR